MLTRKQIWRRTKFSKSSLGHKPSIKDLEIKNCTIFDSLSTLSSSPDICRRITNDESKNIINGGQVDHKCTDPIINRVRFNTVVRVCLIPCRQENFSFSHEMFWDPEDYNKFKGEAIEELKAYWTHHNVSVKEAISALYQPSFIDEKEELLELCPHSQEDYRLLDSMEHKEKTEDLKKAIPLIPVYDLKPNFLRTRDSILSFQDFQQSNEDNTQKDTGETTFEEADHMFLEEMSPPSENFTYCSLYNEGLQHGSFVPQLISTSLT